MKRVAIIIPTKDRVDYLIRTIKYYVSINSPHPIFIGDASSESSEDLILKAAQDKIEVHYFHWENLYDRPTVLKLAQEAKKINTTDYCAFHGDDDFFVSESLSKCAEFLDLDSSYATAQGNAFTFELNKDGPYGKLQDIGIYWNLNQFKGDSALDRLKEISINYWVPGFSVHRINEYIDDINNGLDSVTDMSFGEYVNSMSFALRGKSKFIDCLYLARSIHKNQWNKRKLRDSAHHGRNFAWVTGSKWNVSYNALVSTLSKVLSENDNLSLDVSKKEMNFALEKIIALDTNHTSTYKFIRKKYSEYLGKNGLVFKLSKCYRLIKYSSIFPCKDFSKRSLLSPKSKYYKDVKLILASCEVRN